MDDCRRAFVLAVAMLAVAGVVAPVTVAPVSASPQPEPLCPVCDEQLDRAARDAGTAATATASRMRMTVGEDGDGRVTVRVTLNESTAERFREEPGTVDAVVDVAFDSHGFGVDGARDVVARMDGDALVVTYVVPDVAHEATGGVLLVTAFGERASYVTTNVDAFRLVGPDGWRVANSPASGAVREAADGGGRTGEVVVWRGDADYDSPLRLERGTYVAFAPNEGAVTSGYGELAVAATIGPTMVGDAVAAAGPGALLLAAALAVCLFGLGGSARPARESRLLAVLGGVAAVGGLAHALLDGSGPIPSRNLQLLALPAGIAAFGLLSARSPTVANLREAAIRVAATVGIGGFVATTFSTSYLALATTTVTVAVTGFYLVGVYDQRVGWPVAAVSGIVVATPVLAILPSTPIGGFGPTFAAMLLTPVMLVAALLGVAAYRIGAGEDVAGERVVDSRTTA